MSVHSHLYRRDDPATSKRAAAHSDKFIATHEDKILLCLGATIHGLTYREIATLTRLEPVAVARRLKGMERKGIVWRKHRGLQQGSCGGWHDAYEERESCAVWRTK